MISLRHAEHGEYIGIWQLAAISMAVNCGWFPPVGEPVVSISLDGDKRQTIDLNSAIDFLVTNYPHEFELIKR
jgi:hypothetical protein